ncbi:MAG: hypothetical protein KGL39_43265 [Patescibacteria group bacterium]|nr:hypothetical protein [Patescibacteria group bacterium]
MKWDDLQKYRRNAISTFAPGSGCWIGEDKRPAMIVAQEDMVWFLRCVDLVEEIEIRAAQLIR